MKYYAVFHKMGENFLGETVEYMTGCLDEEMREMCDIHDLFDNDDRFVEITEEEYNALCSVYRKADPDVPDMGLMYGGEGLLCD